MSTFGRYLPWAVAGLILIYFVGLVTPRDKGQEDFDYGGFGSLLVVDRGRFKPMDTVARVNLMHISGGYQTYVDKEGETQPAIRWLLDTMSGRFQFEKARREAFQDKTFVIDDTEILELLELKPRQDARYAIAEIRRFLEPIANAARKIESMDKESRGALEESILAFHAALRERMEETNQMAFAQVPSAKHAVFRIEHDEVLALLGLEPKPGYRYALTDFLGKLKEFYDVAHRVQRIPEKEQVLYERKVSELANRLEVFLRLVNGSTPLAIPPVRAKDDWRTFASVDLDEPRDAFERGYTAVLAAYSEGSETEFNEALESYQRTIARNYSEYADLARLEKAFNEVSPFSRVSFLYILVFLFGCLSWLVWSEPFRKTGLYLAVLLFGIHTIALLTRMYIQGRPPVTNLYSSAVFIGWGAVLTGIILDFIYRNGIGVAAAGLIGALTLFVAHFLSLSGDTLENLQAVLDTNFWLATHVTTITFGYTACFLAGAIGATYILLGVFTRFMNAERSQMVNKMLYGVVCFGMFLSFVGTVLGGIWADQSWGRFWGWDPKENGALLIVLWCALILHARWGGMVKLRGMAMLAVGANIITAWSWFGTNMLGVGLHSYGFVPERLIWMGIFVGSQLAIIALGAIPQNMWRSYSKRRPSHGIEASPQSI